MVVQGWWNGSAFPEYVTSISGSQVFSLVLTIIASGNAERMHILFLKAKLAKWLTSYLPISHLPGLGHMAMPSVVVTRAGHIYFSSPFGYLAGLYCIFFLRLICGCVTCFSQ